MSLPPGLKTVRYRNELRNIIEASGWHQRSWARYVLGVECIQGWAGRKNPSGPCMMHVYCTMHFRAEAIKDIAKLFQKIGLPPFNLVPVRFYSAELEANHLPRGDTQDRFWLIGGYNALDITHWDHWIQTKRYWGSRFEPTAEEALRIMQDPTLFKEMLCQDWERQEHHGEASLWNSLVAKYHHQWPVYSTCIQLHDETTINDLAGFLNVQLTMREKYLHPDKVEVLTLP